MSLLLEALKKAERAKEEAQRQGKANGDAPSPSPEDAAPAQATARRVVTRAELPELSQSFEIRSEDLRPEGQRRSPALALEPEPERAPSTAARAELARETTAAPPRAQPAPKPRVEERFRVPDPRMPFYATLGVIGVIAAMAAGYFWYQLRPAPAFVRASPPRPAPETPAAPSAPQPPSASMAAQSAVPAGSAALPGLPPLAAAPNAQSEPGRPAGAAAQPETPAPAGPAAPRAETAKAAAPKAAAPVKGAPAAPRAAPSKEAPRPLNVSRPAAGIHPRVQAGYAAYQAGDLAAAHAEYQQALRDEPGNRDALLGLAAVETRAQRYEQAEAHYQRLLRSDPRDPHAHAGLLALRSQRIDPLQAESRIKTILAADPEANVLYFTLGNQYAQQGRWAEAHQAYARAYAADAENPDFAFNLAVSLDQLREPGAALEYYRRALELAGRRAAHFSPESARQRVQQLSR